MSGNAQDNSLNTQSSIDDNAELNTSNYWQWNQDKLKQNQVEDLLQEVFSLQNQCSDGCKLWIHIENRRPIQVLSQNEGTVRSVLNHARNKGERGIVLCCSPKNVKLSTMYNTDDNSFNCQRCSENVMNEGSNADESTTVNAVESQPSYAGVDFAPNMMRPSGSRWTSADSNVTPYTMASDQGAQLMNIDPALVVNNTATLQNNNGANQELIYTNARPVINTLANQNNQQSSVGYGNNNTFSDNNNVIFHKHVHTFTNSTNTCN